MVMQDEHRVYPGSDRKPRNTLRPGSLWIVLMYDDILRGSLPALYSTGGKVIYLRNLVPIGYNYCIHGGHNIYLNRLGFLDQQVVSACSARFAEQFGDPRSSFWRVGPPCPAWPMWSHEGIQVYTPIVRIHPW
jgi:hypothetical protein